MKAMEPSQAWVVHALIPGCMGVGSGQASEQGSGTEASLPALAAE